MKNELEDILMRTLPGIYHSELTSIERRLYLVLNKKGKLILDEHNVIKKK